MKQDERCTRCGGEIFPNAGEQWPDGWIHSEPNNCYLTASARAEAAEALAAERLEDALFAEQRATDAELERDGAILAASDAERHAENAMHGLAHFRARVAELEAQLAAQQWRPVTEDWPPYNERVIIGYGGGYGGGWCVFARRVRADDRDGDDWLMDDDRTLAFESAVVAMQRPLPPAPQETE